MPRARLWRDIEKWKRLVPEYEKSIEIIKERIRSEAVSRSSLELVSTANTIGLIDGFIEGMAAHLKAIALGWQGLAIRLKRVNMGVG